MNAIESCFYYLIVGNSSMIIDVWSAALSKFHVKHHYLTLKDVLNWYSNSVIPNSDRTLMTVMV